MKFCLKKYPSVLFLEYYSTMMGCKFHSILLKNGRENSTETGLLAKKYAKLVKRI